MCRWTATVQAGVVNLLSDGDKSHPGFADYSRNYDRIADDDLNSPILDLQYVQRQAANLCRIARDVRGLEILDLGCGQGFLTRMLMSNGAKSVAAVDISSAYLSRLAGLPGVVPILANAEKLPFQEAFDLVVSTDVMEHVLNVGSFLISLNDSLRMDGRAIIRVPYRENLIAYAAQTGCRYEFVHLRAFNRRLLHETLAGAGLKVERTSLDGFSMYSPQRFWIAGPRRKAAYLKLQEWALSKVDHPSTVTTWPWPLAALFMRPAEIVVVARKIRPAIDRAAA
jgi:SAM-dependent methyltransferase